MKNNKTTYFKKLWFWIVVLLVMFWLLDMMGVGIHTTKSNCQFNFEKGRCEFPKTRYIGIYKRPTYLGVSLGIPVRGEVIKKWWVIEEIKEVFPQDCEIKLRTSGYSFGKYEIECLVQFPGETTGLTKIYRTSELGELLNKYDYELPDEANPKVKIKQR